MLYPQLPATTDVTPWNTRRRELGVPQHLRVVVRVDVDEAGRHEPPLGVDLARAAVTRSPISTMRPSVDADVGAARRRAAAVDDRAAPDREVGHRASSRAGGGSK